MFASGRLARVVLLIVALVCASQLVSARDILLIDDYVGGFGPVADLLIGEGHTVVELTGEIAAGYSRVSDVDFLSGFDFVIYAARSYNAPPSFANAALETYIQSGGDLLVTGFGDNVSIPDRSAPDLLRALGPQYSYNNSGFAHHVGTLDNYILNGPYGDFRGAVVPAFEGFDQLFANTGLGTVPLVQGESGQPDKVIYTDLPGTGGSVGAWQGGNRFEYFGAAQPDFFDGDVFQGLLLNWAAGGTTSQKAVTPDVFSTDLHPESSHVSVDLYIGSPWADGAFVGTIGPVPVHGTIDVVRNLDASGDGTVALTNASLKVGNVENLLVDLGALGTILADIVDLELYVANQTTDVGAFQFDLTVAPYYVAGITYGSLAMHSPTGLLATLLDPDERYEVLVDEVFYGSNFFQGIFDGNFDGPNAFGLDVGNASLYLLDLGDMPIYGVVRGQFFVAVPEPSTWTMLAVAVAGLLYHARRRRSVQRL